MIGYASRTGTRRNLEALRAHGWRILVSATGPWRPEGFAYCIDNGAWTAYQAGTEFDAGLFRGCVDELGEGADFIIVPDIVGGYVDKWIGFGMDEVDRIKPPPAKFVRFRYPLIELGMDTSDVVDYFHDRELVLPPRSVCNACFANGLNTLRQMYEERPDDWAQAVAVDEAVREMPGAEFPVYVNDTLKPLSELAEAGFDVGQDTERYSCDSGYCFL